MLSSLRLIFCLDVENVMCQGATTLRASRPSTTASSSFIADLRDEAVPRMPRHWPNSKSPTGTSRPCWNCPHALQKISIQFKIISRSGCRVDCLLWHVMSVDETQELSLSLRCIELREEFQSAPQCSRRKFKAHGGPCRFETPGSPR